MAGLSTGDVLHAVLLAGPARPPAVSVVPSFWGELVADSAERGRGRRGRLPVRRGGLGRRNGRSGPEQRRKLREAAVPRRRVQGPRRRGGTWALLRVLPTNAALERRTLFDGVLVGRIGRRARQRGARRETDAALVVGPGRQLGELMGSHHRTMYALQIVAFLLMPADGDEEELSTQLRQAFIRSGGFDWVFAFFMDLDPLQLRSTDGSIGVV